MKKLVSQYINREIKDEESLAKLRDDSEFMLEVFETKMKEAGVKGSWREGGGRLCEAAAGVWLI